MQQYWWDFYDFRGVGSVPVPERVTNDIKPLPRANARIGDDILSLRQVKVATSFPLQFLCREETGDASECEKISVNTVCRAALSLSANISSSPVLCSSRCLCACVFAPLARLTLPCNISWCEMKRQECSVAEVMVLWQQYPSVPGTRREGWLSARLHRRNATDFSMERRLRPTSR